MRKALVFLIFGILVAVSTFCETVEVKPVGEYADIDVSHQNDLVKALTGSDSNAVKLAGEEALQNLDSANPVVLYVLSNVYFASDRDGAAMIFYIAQMRARTDANLCADVSARQAVSILNNYFGPMINKHAFQTKERLTSILAKAISYVRSHEVKYDRRWINLHGLNAMSLDGTVNPAPLSIPKDQWEATIKKTIDDYETDFNEALQKVDFSKVPSDPDQ